MIRRIIAFCLSLLFLFLLVPALALADSGISVVNSSVELNFPHRITFHLVSESDANITGARLHYQVDKMNYANVTSEGWANFIPAERVDTTWEWNMAYSSLPPGAAVTYWWTIADADGDYLKTSPATVCFNDTRYEWQSLTEDNLSLFWYEGSESFGRELMAACHQGLARIHQNTGAYPQGNIKVYIYDSAAALQGAMLYPQEWLGGVAFTQFGIVALGASPENLEWGKKTIAHELTHVVVYQLTFSPYCDLPTWLNEGLAMYSEGGLDPFLQLRLNQAISSDELISVRTLSSPFPADIDMVYLSYAESYSVVQYLISNYGQYDMLQFLGMLKQGSTCDQALSQVYGFDVDGLDSQWQESLSASPVKAEDLYPYSALIATAAALATALALAGALALEDWSWRRMSRKREKK